MAMNKIFKGDRLDYTNNSGVSISSGSPVLAGKLFGVACTTMLNTESGVLDIEGVYELRKANGAVDLGADLYWDADGNPQGAVSGNGLSGIGCLTTTSSGNTYAGRAFKAAGATDAYVQIKLNA